MKLPTHYNVSTYIALLRGINVNGQKIIKMEQLRKSLTDLGFSQIVTYIQSGNIVFKTKSKSTTLNLANQISKKITVDFGHTVFVIVKTSDEIAKIIKTNPLLKQKGIDLAKVHVSFLSDTPNKNLLTALNKLTQTPEQYHCIGNTIFLYCPNGYGKTKLTNTALEKNLTVDATTRNWNTVSKLYELSR